jgi:hypothetical protein
MEKIDMSRMLPNRRGIAERAMFYVFIYGIGASAMIVGGLFDSARRMRRRLRR